MSINRLGRLRDVEAFSAEFLGDVDDSVEPRDDAKGKRDAAAESEVLGRAQDVVCDVVWQACIVVLVRRDAEAVLPLQDWRAQMHA